MKQFSPRWILTVLLTAIALYLMWQMVQPFIATLLWSIVLAIIAYPIHQQLRKWGRSPTVSALITLIAIIVVVVLPLVYLTNSVVDQASKAIPALQDGIRQVMDKDSRIVQWLAQYNIDIQNLTDPRSVADLINTEKDAILKQGFGIVKTGMFLVVQVLLVLFTTFYLLRDTEGLLKGAKGFVPLGSDNTDQILKSTNEIIAASLKGTVMIAAIQAIIGGISFWCLGLSSPLMWGVFMFITAMLPVVGSSLIWAPAALYLAFTGSYWKAGILVVIGVGIIGMLDNLLRPTLVGSKTKMHELVVFFSVMGGLQVFGVLGIIAGPVMVAITAGLLRVFHEMGDEQKPSAGLT